MRFRSTACVLGGILLAGHRAGLADSQSTALSIGVVVTRSCSINTVGALSVTCSRGPTPAIHMNPPAAATSAAMAPLAPARPGTPNGPVTPQQTRSIAPAQSSVAAAPQAQSSAGAADAARAADGVDTSTVSDGGAADEIRSAPLQEILTINF